MEGFTGLNISKAVRDINLFASQASEFIRMIEDFSLDFSSTLRTLWCSPNAKKYTNEKYSDFASMMSDFGRDVSDIITDAIDAARTLAGSNGAQIYSLVQADFIAAKCAHTKIQLDACDEELDGTVGMATNAVRQLMDEYKTEMNRFVSILNSLPEEIAFLDPEGTLVQAYKTNIKTFKEKFENYNSVFVLDMNRYILSESDLVETAKNSAVDILKS